MALCKICGEAIRAIHIINGKRRDLHKRKTCTKCVPYSARKTHSNEDQAPVGKYKCQYCGRIYALNGTGCTTRSCNSCMVNRHKGGRKERAVAYKGGKCSVCGYSRCMSALDFHHVDESTKKFTISGSHSRSWEVVQEELDKCLLLCRNCHAEEHERLGLRK